MEKANEEPLLRLASLEEDVVTVLLSRELYGLQILQALNEVAAARRIGFGSLYPTLHRLVRKGYLTDRWGEESDGESGGARRKYYKVTDLGEQALSATQMRRQQLVIWQPM
jgi:PadR family transcriptional regulator, regulatory protein PadR